VRWKLQHTPLLLLKPVSNKWKKVSLHPQDGSEADLIKVLDWYALPERVAYPLVLRETVLDEVAEDLGVKQEALQSLGQGTFE